MPNVWKAIERKGCLLERTASAFGPLHQHKRCKMQMAANLAVHSEPRTGIAAKCKFL